VDQELASRLDAAEVILAQLRKAERHRVLAEGEAEFRALFGAFLVVAQSVATLAASKRSLNRQSLDQIVGTLGTEVDVTLFRWFREERFQTLKGGVSRLMVRQRPINLGEYEIRRRIDHPELWRSGGPLIGSTSSSTININVYEVQIGTRRLGAIAACSNYVGLLRSLLANIGLE
jgi:hypothetical protein